MTFLTDSKQCRPRLHAILHVFFLCLFFITANQDLIAQCGSGNFTTEVCRNHQTSDPTDDDYFPVDISIPNDGNNFSYNYTTSGGDSGSLGADGGSLSNSLDGNQTWPVTVTVTGQQDGCMEDFIIAGPPSCSPWNCGGISISVVSQGCVGDNLCFDVVISGSDGLAIEILRKLSGADDPNNPNKVILTTGVGDGTYNACVSNADVQADYGGDSFFTVWVHALDAGGAIIFDCVADDLVAVETCSGPTCILTVDGVTPGPCYYDAGSMQSLTDVTVSVSYSDGPAGESIDVDLNGTAGSITPSGPTGSGSTVITVPADGSPLTASANYSITTSCAGTNSSATAPSACTPSCTMTMDAVTVGPCNFNGTSSTADVMVAVSWMDAPPGEDITVDINGTQATIIVGGQTNGSGSTTLTVPADGSTGNSVVAYFVPTSSCSAIGSYDAPGPCAPSCVFDITSVGSGACYWDGSQSLVDVSVGFTWSAAPSGEDIIIDINGSIQTVTPTGTSGSDMVTITLAADGSSPTVFGGFSITSSCGDSDNTLSLPPPCTPMCSLSITSLGDSGCYWDGSQSVVDVTVGFVWSDAPAGEDIVIDLGGISTTVSPSGTSGSDSATLTVPADGSGSTIFVQFISTTSCGDSSPINLPPPCAPACDLVITNVSDNGCVWDGTNSLTDLTIDVSWTNAPSGEDIQVQFGGNIDFISVVTPNGSGSVTLTVAADGSNDFVDVFFTSTTSCDDFTTYTVPNSCEPPCNITIDNVVPGSCTFDGTNSLVDVDVTFSWMNAPTGESIDVFVDGTTVSYTPGASSGTHTQTVTVGATGTTGAAVSVNFVPTFSCFDVSNVDLPPSCSPNCELFVTVNPGACYWNGSSSMVDVDVNVSWANAPTGESIDVNFAGSSMVVTPTGTPGNETITFTVPADGSSGNATANFQTTTTCSASGPYSLPSPCAPNCSITMQVMEGNCYLDGSNNSVVDVVVAVTWTDAPTGENIDVTLGGATQTVTVSSSNGSGMTTFTVAADGSTGNVTAAFNPTSSCSGTAPYTLPQSCDTPDCSLNVSAAPGACYWTGSASMVDVSVTVTWANAPAGEDIDVSLGGTTMVVSPAGTSGSQMLTFMVVADASSGNVTANFQTTTTCTSSTPYTLPGPCSPSCSLTMTVNEGNCYLDGSGNSLVDVEVSVSWSSAPTGENIDVTLGGNTQTIMVGSSSGTGSTTFTVAADGSSGNVTAAFNPTSTCNNTAPYALPNACDNPQCAITDVTVTTECFDAGTPTDPSDDIFRYTITVTGDNTSMTYDIMGDDMHTGLGYGAPMGPFTMMGFPIAGGPLDLIVKDSSIDNCETTVTVDPPATCSDEDCLLNDPIINVVCLDNGTPTDPSDDQFEYTISVTGTNTGMTYKITGDDSRVGLGYGTPSGPFGTFPIAGGDLDIMIMDETDMNCTLPATVEAPATCSDACSIMADISNIQCNDNGTPFISSDDYITFDLSVTGSNTSSSYTVFAPTSGITPSTGSYGGTTTFQMDPGTAGMNMLMTLRVEDSNDPDCRMYVDLQPPGVCSEDCTDPNCFGIKVTKE